MRKTELANPPENEIDRELWLQNVAGYIIFKDVKEYAIEKIPLEIDDAIYGMMMMDGVTGVLRSEEYMIEFENNIKLSKEDKEIYKLDTSDGDGMCMGFHAWKEGDFGKYSIIKNK